MSLDNNIVQLTTRNQPVNPTELIAGFKPPKRFESASFLNYVPNPDFLSQSQARVRLENFVRLSEKKKNGFSFFAKPATQKSLYLDGSFGVGKTHLLAATWNGFACEVSQKLYLSFSELVFFIGALGMQAAVVAFRNTKLICLDEFELDDVGNTLMVAMFFSRLIPTGVQVVATSNTLPEQLGRGRFNSDDFKREIQSIASHFDVLELDGPDYRHREGLSVPQPMRPETLEENFVQHTGTKALEDFWPLLQHLQTLHPIRYDLLLNGVDAIFIRGIASIAKQDDALRFVHFVDKLYDREICVAASGCSLELLFDDAYRYGPYAKKYSRSLSRFGELLRESQQ